MPSVGMVDWDLAVRTAGRLVRPGPSVSYEQAADVVAELRAMVPLAETHVSAHTGLTLPAGDIPVAVVDRPGWVRGNVAGFQVLLDPLVDRLLERRRETAAAKGKPVKDPRETLGGRASTAVGSRVTGVQVGTVLAFLASRVLGQYELFLPAEEGVGRLTLVAPNIVETERALDVDPHDFRLWVVLHEVTHRTQFTAVPWLREHFLAQVHAFVDASDLDPAALLTRLRDVVKEVATSRGGDRPAMLELVQTPAQREVLGRLTALMTLLEGHGDHVMDAVGPDVVPTVATIRRRFEQRRAGRSPVDRVFRRLLGLDLKMRQYAEGSRFVRMVVAEVGMDGFNQVWTSPATLPTKAEIADPSRWVTRVVRGAQETGGVLPAAVTA